MMTVLYHGNCFDGMGAAWAAWKALGDAAVYRPVRYGEPFPTDLPASSKVYILDFSWPRAVLEEMSNIHDVVVLDHHKTAEADLRGPEIVGLLTVFDMNRSGAMLAWEWFHPTVPAPDLIRYLQDRDLWRFALDGSKAVSAVIACEPFTLDAYDALADRFLIDKGQIIAEGQAILRARDQMVATMAANATWREIGGYRVPVANATILFSEVGEALCLQYPEAPFAAYYLDRKDGKRQWGLRSRNGFDVSEVAKQYGGGGHAAAAGFVEERPDAR